MIKNYESTSIEIERSLMRLLNQQSHGTLKLSCHPQVQHYIEQNDKDYLQELCRKHNTSLIFETKDSLHLNAFEFFNESGTLIEI